MARNRKQTGSIYRYEDSDWILLGFDNEFHEYIIGLIDLPTEIVRVASIVFDEFYIFKDVVEDVALFSNIDSVSELEEAINHLQLIK